MAPDERSRMEVSEALAEALGPAAAAALMECIPPFGWHEIATKRDLADLETRLEAKIDAKIDAMSELFTAKLDGRLHQEATRMIKWTVGSIIGLTAAISTTVGVVSAAIS